MSVRSFFTACRSFVVSSVLAIISLACLSICVALSIMPFIENEAAAPIPPMVAILFSFAPKVSRVEDDSFFSKFSYSLAVCLSSF